MRRALSELAGAALLAAATIGLGSLLASQFIGYINSSQAHMASSYRRAWEAEGQLLTLIYQSSNGSHTTLLVYNYGWRRIALQGLQLDGARLEGWVAQPSTIEPQDVAWITIPGQGRTLTLITELGKMIPLRLA